MDLLGQIESTYTLSSEFEIPDFIELHSFDDIVIPPIPQFASSITPNDDDLLAIIAEKDDEISSSPLSTLVEQKLSKTYSMSGKLEDLQELKNIRSYVKLKFSPYEPYFKEWTRVDSVYVNDSKYSVDVETVDGKITYHLKGLVPSRYVLRLRKKDYFDVVFEMSSKMTADFDELEEFDLGNINMRSKHQQLKMTFTWGRLPLDLDAHVFCFDSSLENREHAYFLELKSEKSMIDIDVDDVTSYGPETIHIFQPEMSNWYLLAIHNYSRFVRKEDDNVDMNPEDLVNVKVNLYDFTLDITPAVELYEKYWWDVLLLHENKIYVLNEAPDDRGVNYSRELDYFAKRRLVKLAEECQEVYDISRYIPTSIRWF